MKKSTPKKSTKKVAKKTVPKPKKPKLKFDFAELVKTAVDGAKGKIYAKLLGPYTWSPQAGKMKHQPLEIDFTQFYKPDNSNYAELAPGEAWIQFTFEKVLYSVLPESPETFMDIDDDSTF